MWENLLRNSSDKLFQLSISLQPTEGEKKNARTAPLNSDLKVSCFAIDVTLQIE